MIHNTHISNYTPDEVIRMIDMPEIARVTIEQLIDQVTDLQEKLEKHASAVDEMKYLINDLKTDVLVEPDFPFKTWTEERPLTKEQLIELVKNHIRFAENKLY